MNLTQEERDQFELKQFILTYWQKRTTVHWAVVAAVFASIGFLLKQKNEYPGFNISIMFVPIFLFFAFFLLLWWHEAKKVNLLLEHDELCAQHLRILKINPGLLDLLSAIALALILLAAIWSQEGKNREIVTVYSLSISGIFYFFMLILQNKNINDIKTEIAQIDQINTTPYSQTYEVDIKPPIDGAVKHVTITIIKKSP